MPLTSWHKTPGASFQGSAGSVPKARTRGLVVWITMGIPPTSAPVCNARAEQGIEETDVLLKVMCDWLSGGPKLTEYPMAGFALRGAILSESCRCSVCWMITEAY